MSLLNAKKATSQASPAARPMPWVHFIDRSNYSLELKEAGMTAIKVALMTVGAQASEEKLKQAANDAFANIAKMAGNALKICTKNAAAACPANCTKDDFAGQMKRYAGNIDNAIYQLKLVGEPIVAVEVTSAEAAGSVAIFTKMENMSSVNAVHGAKTNGTEDLPPLSEILGQINLAFGYMETMPKKQDFADFLVQNCPLFINEKQWYAIFEHFINSRQNKYDELVAYGKRETNKKNFENRLEENRMWLED